MTFVPKRSSSDPCEHLFSRMRMCAGSTNNVSCKSALLTVARENMLHIVRPSTKGNCGQAPSLFGIEILDIKKKRY